MMHQPVTYIMVGMTDWLNGTEQRHWRQFLSMQNRLMGQLAAHLQAEAGLSMPDYDVLVPLSEAPGGRLRSTELLAVTCWEKSRLAHHLTRMEKRGLIARETRADDSRYSDVLLTRQGRAAITSAAPKHAAHVRSWFVQALTPEELATFGELSDKITERLGGATPACPVD